MEQARALSSCFTHVVIPWSNDSVVPVEVGHPVGKVYEETGYGLVGIAGESRSGDANGQYIRVTAGGGTNTVTLPPIAAGLETQVGVTPFPLLGAQPAFAVPGAQRATFGQAEIVRDRLQQLLALEATKQLWLIAGQRQQAQFVEPRRQGQYLII